MDRERISANSSSTLNPDGSWSTTGNGNSDDSTSTNFSYGGGGSGALNTVLIGSQSGSINENDTYSEGGSQTASSDVSSNWVLDPSGSWRAANVQDVETGETQSNSKNVFNYSLNQSGGSLYVSRSINQRQTDYTYNDHINLATDINGNVTVSGSGTGTGSVNGLINFQYASNSGGSISGEVLHGSLTLGDSWTQNYASNTLNLSTGSLVHLSSWSTGGTPTNITDTTGAYVNYFANAQLGIAFPDVMPIGLTFNTIGSESYGQIGSPTVTSVVNVTPVANYGTVVPSDPNDDYTPPKWEAAAVWTSRVIGISSLGLAGGLVAADYWASETAPAIIFQTGHAAAHLAAIGLSAEVVESAIATQVSAEVAGAAWTGAFWGTVDVEGKTILYRAFTLIDGTINIGTYYLFP